MEEHLKKSKTKEKGGEKMAKIKKSKHIKLKNSSKGITLIALVITIIVLLILAAVSIATLTGENGILTKANDAKDQTNEANVVEQAKTDIFAYQVDNQNGKITGEQLKTVLDKYFKEVPDAKDLEEKLKDPNYSLKARDGYGGEDIEVKLSELYSGDLETGSKAPEDEETVADNEKSYVGCYADLDGNVANGPEGIIYADLAVGSNRRTDMEYR